MAHFSVVTLESATRQVFDNYIHCFRLKRHPSATIAHFTDATLKLISTLKGFFQKVSFEQRSGYRNKHKIRFDKFYRAKKRSERHLLISETTINAQPYIGRIVDPLCVVG